ncbi:MAG TPA: hypothetical protein VKU40_05140, partial [Thermoanaerobaculia bacterium]|nr:hypothetical protein [Thermoanaerobaculia bacterium]
MRPTRAAADRRRLEAEARLAACAADGEPLSALPAALADLGVAWVVAGRRLGLRADLLPWPRRAALLAMPEPLVPVPLAELPVALPPGLDVEPVGVVDGFEQRHRARLADGTPVVLRTLHPAVLGDRRSGGPRARPRDEYGAAGRFTAEGEREARRYVPVPDSVAADLDYLDLLAPILVADA